MANCWITSNEQKYCYSCYAVINVPSKTPIHQETPNLHRLYKVFYFGIPHNCEKPESYRPCHNLNPYRHRHYAPEGYSCYTLDKPQGINVLLFLLYCYGCTTHPPPMHQELSNLHSLTKFFTLQFPTAWSNQKVPGEATT